MLTRYARVLPRHLQDVWAHDDIITSKCAGRRQQCHATVQRRTVDRSRAWLAGAMTQQDGAMLWTAHHVARATGQDTP
jgi:hypothetical protein